MSERCGCSRAKDGIVFFFVGDTLAGSTTEGGVKKTKKKYKTETAREDVSLLGYCARVRRRIHLPTSLRSLRLYLSACLPPFISRWTRCSPLHACISASLKWGDLRTPSRFHGSEHLSGVTLAFVELRAAAAIKAPLILCPTFTQNKPNPPQPPPSPFFFFLIPIRKK